MGKKRGRGVCLLITGGGASVGGWVLGSIEVGARAREEEKDGGQQHQ